MLNCAPMRISKKFVGSNYNGKQIYVRRKNNLPVEEVRARRDKLQDLERKFLAKSQPMTNEAFQPAAVSADSVIPKTPAVVDNSTSQVSVNTSNIFRSGNSSSFLGVRSNNKAAAAGRALLFQGTNKATADNGDTGNSDGGGFCLDGYSSSELAAELERRAKSQLQSRASVENFLGAAAQLNPQASVESLLANPFASRNSFHGGSANNLLSAAARSNSFHKNSTSNLLNAVRNSFHKNSTNNLLNASLFNNDNKNSSSRNNLLNAAANSFGRNTSANNLLNAVAVSRAKQTSNSDLLNAARSADVSGLQSLLKRGADQGLDARHSAASLSDLLERHNSLDFQGSIGNFANNSKLGGNNWSSNAGLTGGNSGSNLANLRLSLQQNDTSSIFNNSSFGGQNTSGASALAKFLSEQQQQQTKSDAANNATSSNENGNLSFEKEALMQQLRASGFDMDGSPIAEYLTKQQMSESQAQARSFQPASESNEAKLLQMMELKRKFLAAADTGLLGEERPAKRFR